MKKSRLIIKDWSSWIIYYFFCFFQLFMSPCYLAFGTYLKVPVIGMITSSFIDWFSHRAGNPINLAITPGLLTSFTERMTFWERLQNTFITNMIMLQTDYYVNKQNSYVKRYMNLDVEIPELYKNLALILVNSHHSVTGVTTKHTGIIEVGGLHLKEDGDPLTPVIIFAQIFLMFLYCCLFNEEEEEKK